MGHRGALHIENVTRTRGLAASHWNLSRVAFTCLGSLAECLIGRLAMPISAACEGSTR